MPTLFAPVGATLHAQLIQVQQDLAYVDQLAPEDFTDDALFAPLSADLKNLADAILNSLSEVPMTTPDYTTARYDVSPESDVSNFLTQAVQYIQGPLAAVPVPPVGTGSSVSEAILIYLRPLYESVMQSVADTTCNDIQVNAIDNPGVTLDAADAVAAGLPT